MGFDGHTSVHVMYGVVVRVDGLEDMNVSLAIAASLMPLRGGVSTYDPLDTLTVGVIRAAAKAEAATFADPTMLTFYEKLASHYDGETSAMDEAPPQTDYNSEFSMQELFEPKTIKGAYSDALDRALGTSDHCLEFIWCTERKYGCFSEDGEEDCVLVLATKGSADFFKSVRGWQHATDIGYGAWTEPLAECTRSCVKAAIRECYLRPKIDAATLAPLSHALEDEEYEARARSDIARAMKRLRLVPADVGTAGWLAVVTSGGG